VSLGSATNFVGASTALTVSPVDSLGVGVADSDGIADSDGVGAASLSELEELAQTIAASATIPITTIQTVFAEVDCFGFETGFVEIGAAGASTRGAVLAEEIGTGGTEYLLALFRAADFLAVRLAGAFFAAFFVAFLAVFFTALLLATDFFATFFLAADFLTADFFAGDFLADFFAVFLTATVTPWIVNCT
jgi:hypothetical protein